LPNEEYSALRTWFIQNDAATWDRQFERDVAEGRLDALAEEALRDVRRQRRVDP